MTAEKTIVCRCEEVTLGTIQDTVQTYCCSSREVKLRTRAGMGYCGGRTCRHVIDRVVAEITKEPIKDEVQLSYRSPIRPATFAVLGGGKHDNES
ncbi:(2Fe-2S)-binding protein [Oceanobacillus polygoni]|uniref:NAD(P)H-nitrite reductase large subunit n=1 Tax=Oceanobacillus polygoni TaxID=1235259 RepID=A0A9X0YS32_9BACI|nr:(2Fe-2S)-binding protein [Oceanobacillus polygoni]MBP2077061.1 NAD(P)H-nitrite reductase large subunit [Oceanobacillus polygoni]